MDIGIDQDYQPIQPIAFSHEIHAGQNKVDCQYCHSSAKHSKHSGIPSVNVCMNCHKSISEYTGPTTSDKTKAFYDGEIQKIYDAIGWDKEKLAYIENYEEKPIEWIRIHNLPDFAYYNHAQHVTAGGIQCQTCQSTHVRNLVLRGGGCLKNSNLFFIIIFFFKFSSSIIINFIVNITFCSIYSW